MDTVWAPVVAQARRFLICARKKPFRSPLSECSCQRGNGPTWSRRRAESFAGPKCGDRHAHAKSPISLRLAPEQIAAAKHIAAAKSVGYQTQLRMWIAEGIRREAKRA